ncbi:MAG: FAD-linked oxidase C-terminal domain-containing protein, partial [Betaproteobacteria bacterium]
RPAAVTCALVALPDAAAAVDLLHLLSGRSDQRLCLFELMLRAAVMQATTLVPGCRSPFANTPPAMALVELEGSNEAELRGILESVLTEGLATGLVLDAAVAMSEAQRLAFWRLREALPEANGRAGWVTSHDICLPIGKVPDYLTQLDAALAARSDTHRAMVFGHLGDGNLHVTVVGGTSTGDNPFALEAALSDAVLAPAIALGGSVSAEHGIGSEKVALLARTESPTALAMMCGLKNLLDPKGIMNPGKVLARTHSD